MDKYAQGLKIPALGFGTWRMTGQQCTDMVAHALKLGYRHIDTARVYDNEREVGHGLAESGVAREDIFVTTKVWQDNLAPADLRASVEASLRDLGTDYADLVLIHWPTDTVPLGESLAAFRELQAEGKLRGYGVSNFPVAWMKAAVETEGHPIVCNQVEYHPFLNQDRVLAYARANDILVTAYCPLARGKVAENPRLQKLASKYERTTGQIALRWLIQQEGVLAVPKTATPERARENLAALDFELSDQDMAAIHALTGDGRLIDPSWAPAWDSTTAP